MCKLIIKRKHRYAIFDCKGNRLRKYGTCNDPSDMIELLKEAKKEVSGAYIGRLRSGHGLSSLFTCAIFVLTLSASCGKEASPAQAGEKVPFQLTATAEATRSMVTGPTLTDTYAAYTSSYFTSYTAPETDGDYFIGLPFRSEGGVWLTSPIVYWPLGGKLDILSVACEDGAVDARKSITWHEGNSSQGVEVTLKDGECLDSEILFAASYNRTVEDGAVPLHFKHAQCWLQFAVETEQDILRIDRIVLEDAYTGGLFRVSNNVYMDAGWIFRGHHKGDVTVPGSEGLVPVPGSASVCDILVPEQEACDIAVHYSMKDSPSDDWSAARSFVYRYKAGVNPWFYGEKNVFRIGFSFSAITMTTAVMSWEEDSYEIKVD